MSLIQNNLNIIVPAKCIEFFFLAYNPLDLLLINPIGPIWPTHPDWNPGGWKDGAAMLVQMENQSWEGAEDVAEIDFDDEDILRNVISEAEND